MGFDTGFEAISLCNFGRHTKFKTGKLLLGWQSGLKLWGTCTVLSQMSPRRDLQRLVYFDLVTLSHTLVARLRKTLTAFRAYHNAFSQKITTHMVVTIESLPHFFEQTNLILPSALRH